MRQVKLACWLAMLCDLMKRRGKKQRKPTLPGEQVSADAAAQSSQPQSSQPQHAPPQDDGTSAQDSNAQTTTADSSVPTEGQRTLASLLLFIHCFCVAIVLTSSFLPSELQLRLVQVVAPYTKTLHLDPNFVPFQLTAGDDGFSRLHQWQVLDDKGRVTHRFPDNQMRGGFTRERQDMYARVGAFYAADAASESDVPPAMAKALARHVLLGDNPSSGAKVIQCVRYVDDADPATADPESDAVAILYVADAWLGTNGEINVLKRTEARRVAPPVSTEANP